MAIGSLPGRMGSASGSTLVAATTGLPNTPLIVEGLKSLRVQSCIIDGEAVWVIPSQRDFNYWGVLQAAE